MLGWPSATFPLLINTKISPILITWDESAMIAGFLMEGNIMGTLFSSTGILGSKTGVLLSVIFQTAGWIAMFFAEDIMGIGVSRSFVGIGNGFGMGQLRIYAKESCEPQIYQMLMQYLPLSVNVGVIFTYIVGGFVSFRTLSLVCVAFPIVNMCLFAMIPKHVYKSTSENSLESIGTIYQSKTSVDITRPENKSSNDVEDLNNTQISFFKAVRNRKIRTQLFLLFLIVLIPQYTGGAANIVYSQVVHTAALNPYPHLSSVIYSFIFLFSTITAIKYTTKFPRRLILLGSCLICSLLLCAVGIYFYFSIDLLEVSSVFVWSPLLLLSLFNFFHSMGVNAIPILFVTDKFPEYSRIVASKCYVVYFSASAVISTKIFQVIFTYHGMHMAYAFLSAVSFGGAILAFLVFKEPTRKQVAPITEVFYSSIDLRDENLDKQNTKPIRVGNNVTTKDEIITSSL